jgi:hypothetical protein
MTYSIVEQLGAELERVNHDLAVLEQRRDGIRKLIGSYTGQPTTARHEVQEIPTIQMAQQVLEEHGEPMATAEIRRAIQRKFNVVPASSLQQMLYMRARNKKTFFNENKKYGLLVWRMKK